MNVKDKKVLVVGNARSGIGAAKLAKKQGAIVCIYDQKPYEKWDQEVQEQIYLMEKEGITFLLGKDVLAHDFDLLIISPGVPLEINIVQQARDLNKEVIGEFEFASRFCKAPIIAITGTNGKTTTTTLVGEIFKNDNPHTYIVGNIGRAFSEDVLDIPEEGIVVAEVSSFQLETVENFHPKVSAILNITPDHLNRHHTMENYCTCKYNIMKNQVSSDFCVINTRDDYFEEVQQKGKCEFIQFSINTVPLIGAYMKNNQLVENIMGTERVVCNVEELKIKGTHNTENALAAIAIATAFGVPLESIKKTLITFKGVEHRTEYVMTKNGVDFFNDSKATNTDAAIAGLLGLSVLNKPIRLIAGGMDKQISFRPWTRLFAGRVEKVYIIGETKDQIVRECMEENYHQTEVFESFEEAILKAYEESHLGECILLSPACASWDMFESYEQRGEIFKNIVNHLEG